MASGATPLLLDRRGAEGLLRLKFGLTLTADDLARFAVRGGGPPFRMVGGRPAKALYNPHDLARWAQDYLGPVLTRVSDHPAVAQRKPRPCSTGSGAAAGCEPPSLCKQILDSAVCPE